MKTMLRDGLLLMAGALLVVLASGCGPTYPECHSDENCAEKSEYCLNGQCAACRDDGHCTTSLDESYVCEGGNCQKIVGYCSPPAFPCPTGQKCRDPKTNNPAAPGRCGVECLADDECKAGQLCQDNRCVDKPECVVDADCPTGKVCKNGVCEQPAVCQPRAIYFDFDESAIRSDEKSTLQTNADCYAERGEGGAQLTGHCDERGTEEYNMALGERRAKAAAKAFKNAGAKKSVSQRSRGEYELAVPSARSEGDHAKNRRVEFQFD